MATVRLEPQDEYTHPVEEAQNFNESMYFNVYDPEQRVGGFFRLGNRPNEGYAEMTCCLYLPDGRVGFMFGRPPIEDNDAFDAGGMAFRTVTPFERLDVSYQGKVCLLTDPLEMADPKSAFTSNPHEPARVELAYRGVSPMYGGEPVDDDGNPIQHEGSGFARAHYEQHVAAEGTITVGDETWAVNGFGLRDHSWGPRFWQSPWWYRWLTINFGEDLGMMVTTSGNREGEVRGGGMVLVEGRYDLIRDATIETEWSGTDLYHQKLRVTARTDNAEYHVDGQVITLIPLRNRRTSPDGEQLLTRISEGMTEYRCDGRVGYGLSEYLDQIIDGRPVGIDH